MFLDSLTAILRKHRIRLQNQEQVGEFESGTCYHKATETDALAPGCSAPLVGVMNGGLQAFDNLEFDELWQSYIDMESTIDPQNWGALVSDVENLYQGSEH